MIAVPNASRIAAKLTRGDETIVNVWHINWNGEPTVPQAEPILDAFMRFYVNVGGNVWPVQRGLKTVLSNQVVLDSLVFQNINSDPPDDPIERVVTLAGDHVGQLLPLSNAVCVGLRTGLATKRGRGRVFLGGFTEENNDIAGGYPRPSAALRTAISNAVGDLMGTLQNIVDPPQPALAVASKTGVPNARTVTSARVSDVWSSQRRRQKSINRTVTTVVAPTQP